MDDVTVVVTVGVVVVVEVLLAGLYEATGGVFGGARSRDGLVLLAIGPL